MKWNRIFLTGDKHLRDLVDLYDFTLRADTSCNDLLVILGDVGLNFYHQNHQKTIKMKEFLKQLPITLLCLRGNHEARPSTLANMHWERPFDDGSGPVMVEEGYPNIYYVPDPCAIYFINGKSFFCVNGAYSVDKWYRLANHYTWFEDEQLSDGEMKIVEKRFARQYKKFDYILTHTCPYEWRPRHLFLSYVDQSTVDNTMEHFFSKIKEEISFKKWYFGHYHADWDVPGEPAKMLYKSYEMIE